MTPPVRAYLAGMAGVTNYVNRTFSLFRSAEERRPKQMLVRKERR